MKSLYSGLISYWNLRDASGSRLDLTGAANTLTNTNVVTSVDGFIGAASNFASASSQRLQLASNASIQGGPKNYTFAAWVQLASKPAAQMHILGKGSAVAGQAEYALYWDNVGDRFNFEAFSAVDSGALAIANTFGAPSTSVWYFVCGWYDNDAQTVNIDINAAALNSSALGAAAQVASAAAFAIGAFGLTAATYWNGKICEVGKWDRVLTLHERQWLYNNGYGRTFPFDGRYSPDLNRHNRSRRMNGMAL